MLVRISSAEQMGQVVRAVRKAARIRIDDAASTAGVSKQFTSDVEHGKETVQFGRVLKLLAELGIVLQADIPASAAQQLESLRQQANEGVASRRATAAKL